MKSILLISALVLFGFFASAQPENKNQGGCYGLVTETGGKQAVEYANINVFAAKGSSLIKLRGKNN